MPTIVQFRRGTQTQNNNFLGSSGELSIDTSANSLRVHDGVQTGGYELARADLSNITVGILTSVSIGTGAGNTEVISSARELKNITSIDSNTKSSLSSALLDDTSSNINTGSVNVSGIVTATNIVSVKSDDGTSGRLDLYCESNNAHYARLQAPDHGAFSGNPTIKLPATSGTLLLNNGNGVNLSGIITSLVAGSGIQITGTSGAVTVTATGGGGGGGGGGLSAIQIKNDNTVVGSAGTFNYSDDFSVPVISSGIATVNLSENKTFSISAIQPATGGAGFIGTVGNSWSHGHFTELTVDNLLTATKVLNVREALDLGDGDVLRFGDSDDVSISYDGTANRIGLTLSNTATDFAIKNGSTAFAVFNRSNGRLGIGNESPTEALDVTGNIKASQTVSAADFNTTSDATLKTDISTIENAVELISSIRGVRFTWKEKLTPSLGVIAQEVEAVCPELVTDGNPKQVNYNGLIGVLVESVKELNTQVNDLKVENENIKETLSTILNKLS